MSAAHLAQDIRNAYDARDREALERAIARITVLLTPQRSTELVRTLPLHTLESLPRTVSVPGIYEGVQMMGLHGAKESREAGRRIMAGIQPAGEPVAPESLPRTNPDLPAGYAGALEQASREDWRRLRTVTDNPQCPRCVTGDCDDIALHVPKPSPDQATEPARTTGPSTPSKDRT